MTTALDTNLLVLLWTGSPSTALAAQTSLERAANEGPLLVCAPVYAELLAAPGRSTEFVDRFLDRSGIGIDWNIGEAVWRDAAAAFRAYAERRRTQGDGRLPRRILTDFVIGAHAANVPAALLTFDRRTYRAAFPSLHVVTPEE